MVVLTRLRISTVRLSSGFIYRPQTSLKIAVRNPPDPPLPLVSADPHTPSSAYDCKRQRAFVCTYQCTIRIRTPYSISLWQPVRALDDQGENAGRRGRGRFARGLRPGSHVPTVPEELPAGEA